MPSKEHDGLVDAGEQVLKSMGYSNNQIFREYEIKSKFVGSLNNYYVDIVGLGSKKTFIECGNINKQKIEFIKKCCDKFIHIPYKDERRVSVMLSKENYKVLCTMKDEYPNFNLSEFINKLLKEFLNPKLHTAYCFLDSFENAEEIVLNAKRKGLDLSDDIDYINGLKLKEKLLAEYPNNKLIQSYKKEEQNVHN